MLYVDHGPGGPASAMRLAEGPKPSLQPGYVLIEVHYAGVNRPELFQRAGLYPPPPGASPILGLEVSGRIVERASDVTQWRVGDLVCALAPGGGYAEYCAVHASHCLPIPKGLSLVEAASLPENFFTVWANVFDSARLKSGERFLVHGGSSGIGLAAIQLAKLHGATVYTTVGNSDKAEVCRSMGADVVYNYREEDWAGALWHATGKHGVDVILDMVGGDYFMKNLRSLAIEGRLALIAFIQGSKIANFDAMYIMIRRLTINGSTLRARSVVQKAAIADALREHVWPLLETRRLKTFIHTIFPLSEVGAAHELMESSVHIGKIMLEVRPAA
ncbi:MAG TPA: NAD(P)H-quinone oxidoreductase [Burkholderiales bacterium]|jgi:putative NAD(P)H quinone oxidoreductase, PIG3 family